LHYTDGKTPQAATLVSEWKDLTITPPPVPDSEALKALKALSNPCWLFEPQEVPSRSNQQQRDWEQSLQAFLNQYPNSSWSPFVHLALAYALQITKPAEAVVHLRAVEAVQNFPLQKEVQQLERVFGRPQSPPALDVFDRTVKQLESEHYDVKGYLRDISAPDLRDYQEKKVQIYEQYLTKRISLSEARRQDAALLDAQIRKHRQPLSPQEWQRRYDRYAKEKAAQEEKRWVERQKHLVEGEQLLLAPRTNSVHR